MLTEPNITYGMGRVTLDAFDHWVLFSQQAHGFSSAGLQLAPHPYHG